MKAQQYDLVPPRTRGFSLVEITLVIGLMLALASLVTYSMSSMTEWKTGRSASEKLKSVYIAQKSFLADHPTMTYSSLTSEELIPYLPGNPGAFPTQESLANQSLTLNFQVMPPQWQLSSSAYDPSDSDKDGLWDVGGL